MASGAANEGVSQRLNMEGGSGGRVRGREHQPSVGDGARLPASLHGQGMTAR